MLFLTKLKYVHDGNDESNKIGSQIQYWDAENCQEPLLFFGSLQYRNIFWGKTVLDTVLILYYHYR